jgi:hypothetical protein
VRSWKWVTLAVSAGAIAVAVLYLSGSVFLFDPRATVSSAELVSSYGERRTLFHAGSFYMGFVRFEGELKVTCVGGSKSGDYVTGHMSNWHQIHDNCRLQS